MVVVDITEGDIIRTTEHLGYFDGQGDLQIAPPGTVARVECPDDKPGTWIVIVTDEDSDHVGAEIPLVMAVQMEAA